MWCTDVLKKRYWQGKCDVLEVKRVPSQLCEPHTHKLACDCMRAFVVRGSRSKHVIERCLRLCSTLLRVIMTEFTDCIFKYTYTYIYMMIMTDETWFWTRTSWTGKSRLLSSSMLFLIIFDQLSPRICPNQYLLQARNLTQTLTLLTRILDVSGSNLGGTPTIVSEIFHCFCQFLHDKC
jgi:hypothetical protein